MIKSPTKSKLSIIILNYNSGEYLLGCLDSLNTSNVKDFEVVVVDNASIDKSVEIAKRSKLSKVKYLVLENNLGFSAGNNQGLGLSDPNTPYVLFLNPDTLVRPDTIGSMIDLFQTNSQISAATCKIVLAKTQRLQPECHRGFPTPWRSFCYFSGLSKIFPHSRLFSGYFLGHLDINTAHPIEACVGAFFFIKRGAGDQLHWWNEKYFMYGEDLDFCYRLKQNNLFLYYNPHTYITHFQGISSGIKKTKSIASRTTRLRSALATTQAMRYFYQDHYFSNYGPITRHLVLLGIKLLELQRIFKAKFL